MTENTEPTTLGLSDDRHETLKVLKAEGYFPEMQDAYRFAIALAARKVRDVNSLPDVRGSRTIFNVGTLDSDRRVRDLIEAVLDVPEGRIYKTAERLAEFGIGILGDRLRTGTLSFIDLIEELQPEALGS